MPRKPRTYLPGIPCHVIQRGNNRNATFYSPDDYQVYLACLGEACKRYRVQLHAYVLMTNHVHLLMTPGNAFGISQVMQSLGRRYVQYANRRYVRTGTMWEGRHKASLVQTDTYLLACHRYIEMNPVRARMVSHPAEYRWSSYRHNALGEFDSMITAHSAYEGLGPDTGKRQEAYRGLFATDLEPKTVDAIRLAAACSMPLGNDRFRSEVENALGRQLGEYRRGRPRKRAMPSGTEN